MATDLVSAVYCKDFSLEEYRRINRSLLNDTTDICLVSNRAYSL